SSLPLHDALPILSWSAITALLDGHADGEPGHVSGWWWRRVSGPDPVRCVCYGHMGDPQRVRHTPQREINRRPRLRTSPPIHRSQPVVGLERHDGSPGGTTVVAISAPYAQVIAQVDQLQLQLCHVRALGAEP